MSTQPSDPPNDSTIQRILFIAPRVHIYTIPPLTSTKGYSAASWTDPSSGAKEIFLARLRVQETSLLADSNSNDADNSERVTVDVLLEDPATGDLFAAAPYTNPSVVQPAIDSSRFFALTVVAPGGMKAILGIGFEERSEAIDFGISLQECAKTLSLSATSGAGPEKRTGSGAQVAKDGSDKKRDWSLKEGETIKVDIGSRRSRPPAPAATGGQGGQEVEGGGSALFSIKPPPPPATKTGAGGEKAGNAMPVLAPPPSAQSVRAEKRRSRGVPDDTSGTSAKSLGFDDGEFGEFQ